MAETSEVYFYNSRDGDRKYDADSMTEWLKPFFTTGVFNGGLQVTANGNMTVTIQPGHVNIGGKVRNFKEPTTLDLEVASGTLNRYSSVFVRRDDVERDIYLIVKTGGLAALPTPPDVKRDDGIYDLKLADVYVAAGTISITQANITDTRMIKAVCGWVTATITEMDFTQIQAQFNAFFAEYKPRIEADYNAYVQSIISYMERYQNDALAEYTDFVDFVNLYKQYVIAQYNAFISYLAGYEDDSAAAYAALIEWFNSYKVNSQAEFQEWFDTIKGILGPDEAGNLLLMIQAIQARLPSATIGTIQHGFDHYPLCTLYRVPYGYGVGGYGSGVYGGGNLETVPAEFELEGITSVAVKTIAAYEGYTGIAQIGPAIYGFYSADSTKTDSLILILR